MAAEHIHHNSIHSDKRAIVRRVLLVTLLLNVFIAALKLCVGVATGSLSLQANGLESVTDGANNVLALITNHLAAPQPDHDHPYGHQKFEAIGALGVAAFLSIALFEIARGAVERLFFGARAVQISLVELLILTAVLIVNVAVTLYERRIGQRVDSILLLADARHTLSDVWITIIVLVGLVGVYLGDKFNLPQLQYVDLLLTLPVLVLVARSGWHVLRENLPWLLDEVAIAPEAIHHEVMSVPGVVNCHDIASRGLLGRQVFIEMHLIVRAEDVETAHQITEAVEDRLEQKFAPARVSIHLEPPSYQSDQISFE